MARDWAPLAGGAVELRFVGNPFDFKSKTLMLRPAPRHSPARGRAHGVGAPARAGDGQNPDARAPGSAAAEVSHELQASESDTWQLPATSAPGLR